MVAGSAASGIIDGRGPGSSNGKTGAFGAPDGGSIPPPGTVRCRNGRIGQAPSWTTSDPGPSRGVSTGRSRGRREPPVAGVFGRQTGDLEQPGSVDVYGPQVGLVFELT